MRFLVYSEVNAETIAASMGQSEYSYYFVLKEFLPVLRELGDVRVVKDPHAEADALYREASAAGDQCVLLAFTPPHKTPLGLYCPTIPVLAWEFDIIPNEYWLKERQQDWRHALSLCGRAITHSGMTLEAIRREMGMDYPVISVPAPVWDRYESLRARFGHERRASVVMEMAACVVFDSQDPEQARFWPDWSEVVESVAELRGVAHQPKDATDLPVVREQSLLRITYRYVVEWYRQIGRKLLSGQMSWRPSIRDTQLRTLGEQPLPHPELWRAKPHRLELSGVVFTSMFNPGDGRKNWPDMLTAFCTAFRDCDDATLVFKLGSNDFQRDMYEMMLCLARLPRFTCRVVFLHGFLEGEAFEGLIEASHFVVNASYGEGQCLPLMEFLSCGRPAVAPRNSAMLDYMDESVGFVVEGWSDPAVWPHDPREAYRGLRQQIDWESLMKAYQSAYQCAKTPEHYAALSRNAIERMRGHCSRAVAKQKLQDFLGLINAG